MRSHRRYILAGALLLLTACAASPPTRYYTLDRVPGTAVTPTDRTPVRLDRVTIPAELDRRELVLHVGPDRLRITGQDRWAAPLDDLMLRTLSADLAARLPPGVVADPREPLGTAPRRLLYVQIGRLYADEHCAVELAAAWTLETPNAASHRASEVLSVPPQGECPGAAPAGIDRALGELADRIAAALAH